MNRTSAVTLFCRNNCITFVRFRLIGEFMDFSSRILHFVFLHYANQVKKARFRVTAAVTPLQKYFCVFQAVARSSTPDNLKTPWPSRNHRLFSSLFPCLPPHFRAFALGWMSASLWGEAEQRGFLLRTAFRGVTAAVTLFVSVLVRRTLLILQKQKKRPATSPFGNVSGRFAERCVCCFTVVEAKA